MVTIVMRDALRAQVERASQGRQTVLYTAKGQPSYMNVVPLVTLAALGLAGAEGPHPAFIVGGRERGEFFYGSYGGVIRAGELVSLPGVAPGAWMDFAGASDAARLRIGLAPEHQRGARRADAVVPAAWSCGAGQHRQRPLHPRARGARPARRRPRPGDGQGDPATLTGSGPARWRHDHTAHGIADLCGNLWEWQAGLRLVDGKSRSFQTTTPCRPTCPRHPPTGGR